MNCDHFGKARECRQSEKIWCARANARSPASRSTSNQKTFAQTPTLNNMSSGNDSNKGTFVPGTGKRMSDEDFQKMVEADEAKDRERAAQAEAKNQMPVAVKHNWFEKKHGLPYTEYPQ
jgi:hypothetical protein